VLRAAAAAALMVGAGSGAAFAQTSTGHWEWKSVPNFGPRAPFQAPKRVWIADPHPTADCDCMKMRSQAG